MLQPDDLYNVSCPHGSSPVEEGGRAQKDGILFLPLMPVTRGVWTWKATGVEEVIECLISFPGERFYGGDKTLHLDDASQRTSVFPPWCCAFRRVGAQLVQVGQAGGAARVGHVLVGIVIFIFR